MKVKWIRIVDQRRMMSTRRSVTIRPPSNGYGRSRRRAQTDVAAGLNSCFQELRAFA